MKISTREGLWVSGFFTEKFGSGSISPAKTVPAFKKLEEDMTDRKIRSRLGAQECTLEDIAAFLENPPEGTEDGYWNIFYIAGYVVYVLWYAARQEWRVNAWKLDDSRWGAGTRVFSRNWGSDSKASVLEASDILPSAAVATTSMSEQQKAALRYLLAYVERWNKKDEDAEAAHAQGILEDYLSGA